MLRGPQRGDRVSTVSIILPAFNEERTIAQIVRRCRATLPLSEILVIDDGSVDATAARAEEAGARVVRLERNAGKGNALRLGIDLSKGDVLVFLDADGQDDPEEIPLLLEPIDAGADLVVGSRFLGQFDPGAITTINRYGTMALTGIVNRLFGVRITDLLAGFRAVRRSLIERIVLEARGYDIETDLLLQAVKVGGRAVEVPVRRGARHHGSSSLNPIFDGVRILARIFRVRFQLANGAR